MAGETKSLCMTGMPASAPATVYAGDVTPKEAFAVLSSQPAVLVDVRTPEEWAEGQPDVSATPSNMLSVSIKTLPDYTLNPNFTETITSSKGIDKNTPLYFLCGSGGRSATAATLLAALGYKNCYNIDGGWKGYKSCGLPQQQHRI